MGVGRDREGLRSSREAGVSDWFAGGHRGRSLPGKAAAQRGRRTRSSSSSCSSCRVETLCPEGVAELRVKTGGTGSDKIHQQQQHRQCMSNTVS